MACALQAMTLCFKAYRQSQPARRSKGGSSRCCMLQPRGPEICETNQLLPMKKYKIAVLDDYQNAALDSADWSSLRDRADIAVFQDHLADPDAVIERLLPFDVVC